MYVHAPHVGLGIQMRLRVVTLIRLGLPVGVHIIGVIVCDNVACFLVVRIMWLLLDSGSGSSCTSHRASVSRST